jgi:putative heme-binding domain-containing protein
VAALKAGAAEDAHLRYETAWHIAKNADDKVLGTLLASDNPNVRLAGLIAIDVALWEKFETRTFAEQALAAALAQPGEVDPMLLIKLADMNRSPALIAPLQALIARPGLSTDLAVHAILLLRTLSPAGASNLGDQAGANLLAAMRTGRVPIKTVDDALVMLQLLPIEGPTDFSLAKLGQYLFERNNNVREIAHATARMFGVKSAPLAAVIWQRLLAKGLAPEEKVELLTTLVAIEPQPDPAKWAGLLKSPEPAVVREAVRAWRRFKGHSGATQLLVDQAPELVKRDKTLAGDLAAVLTDLKADPAAVVLLGLPPSETDKAVLAKSALAQPATPLSVALGRQVFVRATCVKCHNTTGSEIKIGPPLTGIGRVQKPEYLIESILEPSKIIKTGFETETVQTSAGQVLSGLVREHGDELEIIEADKTTRLPKSEVETRQVQKKSLMPEGIETQLSADELADLLAFLVSLKVGGPGDAAK